MSRSERQAGSILTIDLAAIVDNWRQLSALGGGARCAAVIKADAYGLGDEEVACALQAAGCRDFFVAHLDEALRVRKALGPGSSIAVLNGTPAGAEREVIEASLLPVVNTLRDLADWGAQPKRIGHPVPVILQVDSGMSRLGLASADVVAVVIEGGIPQGLAVQLVMSHLACADMPDHPANEAQKAAFDSLRAMLPRSPASLANSSGIFLAEGFHYDLLRPGAALYGINPVAGAANPMRQVVSLSARVLQTRDVRAGTGIGYGHRTTSARPSQLATICLGYADGWPRNAEIKAFFRGQRLPFAGRVSMDTIVVDTTDCVSPPREGDLVDMICPQQSVDDIATAAGTIGYEILTRLGSRFERRYLRPPAHIAQTNRSTSETS